MRLIVYRDTTRPAADPSARILSFDELRAMIGRDGLARHIFRYSAAELRTYSLDSFSRPFLLAATLRAVSRGRVTMSDERGVTRRLTLRKLTSLFMRYMSDRRARASVAKEAVAEVRGSSEARARPVLDLSQPPLYLRTDLSFGVRSGGSVGHIAGVLCSLEKYSAPPVFVSSDAVPTVPDSVETHVIAPPERFADFPETWALAYTTSLAAKVPELLDKRKPAFVYQRYSLDNYAGLLLSRSLDVPFVLEFNSSEVWKAKHWGRDLSDPETASVIEDSNLRSADLVVGVSTALREQVVTEGVDPSRVLVNPSGVDPSAYSPDVDGSRVRDEYGLGDSTVIGFIGTFGPWHGADMLAEAFGRVVARRDDRGALRLLMVGDGSKMADTRSAVARHGIEELVTFTGAVPQERGPEYLAAMDVLVSPHVPNPDGTPFFGSPTKLFEYMAMGKGIVASSLDQIADVLDDGRTAVLVEPGDPSGLAEGIERLADDAEMRTRLGAAAREKVASGYTWEKHTGRIVEALRRVAG